MVLLVYGRLGYVHVCEDGWVLLGYGRLGYVHVCEDRWLWLGCGILGYVHVCVMAVGCGLRAGNTHTYFRANW